MRVVYSDKCLGYCEEGHPESPQRIIDTYNFLKSHYNFITPEPAEEAQIKAAHSEELINLVKSGRFIDPDSPAYPNIYEYAKLAAGAAITAQKNNAFSLMRPPGHHASRNSLGGFCYLNNIAIAIRNSGKETIIVDIDGHHGNGTQDIFLGDDSVVFVSLHSSPNYPGTGLSSEKNCFNYPLPPYITEEQYINTLKKAISSLELEGFKQVAVSAGFDTFKGDLASLNLEISTYKKIGEIIAGLNLPTFCVLEGGYSNKLGECIHSFISGLGII